MGSAGKYAAVGKYALTGLDSRLRGNDEWVSTYARMTERGYARSPVTASSLHFGSMTIKYVRISCGGNHGQSTLRTEPHRTHSCLSLIHISEPTRLGMISYAVFCLKKKKKK